MLRHAILNCFFEEVNNSSEKIIRCVCMENALPEDVEVYGQMIAETILICRALVGPKRLVSAIFGIFFQKKGEVRYINGTGGCMNSMAIQNTTTDNKLIEHVPACSVFETPAMTGFSEHSRQIV